MRQLRDYVTEWMRIRMLSLHYEQRNNLQPGRTCTSLQFYPFAFDYYGAYASNIWYDSFRHGKAVVLKHKIILIVDELNVIPPEAKVYA